MKHKNKPYPISETSADNIVNEPAAIYETKKEERALPCTHSEKEIKQSIDEAIRAIEAGDMSRFVKHEEIKKRHLS